MNIFKLLSFFTLLLLANNVVASGVRFEYVINFNSKCRSQIRRFAFLQGLSIAQCAEECGLRQHCASLNYRRRSIICELFSAAEEGDETIRDCVFIPASNIIGIQSECGVCDEAKVCDSDSQQCCFKECQTPIDPENGKILGNKYEIGGRIKYVCHDIETGSDVDAVCLSSGQWSRVANCTIDCYINHVLDYVGRKNITETGYACERWDDHIGEWGIDAQYIPETSLDEAKNYCRNPTDNNWDLWCFSSRPNEEWEYCGIPQC